MLRPYRRHYTRQKIPRIYSAPSTSNNSSATTAHPGARVALARFTHYSTHVRNTTATLLLHSHHRCRSKPGERGVAHEDRTRLLLNGGDAPAADPVAREPGNSIDAVAEPACDDADADLPTADGVVLGIVAAILNLDSIPPVVGHDVLPRRAATTGVDQVNACIVVKHLIVVDDRARGSE